MRQRPGQQMIGFKCEADLHEEIFQAANGNISQFLREAIAEKLTRLGVKVDPALVRGRSRKGVGGPKKIYQVSKTTAAIIAEQSGTYNSITQNLSTSPPVPPQRGAHSKAGKKPTKKK